MILSKEPRETGIRNSNPTVRNLAGIGGANGFTLLELILATVISAIIVAMVSVSFSFALRLWERHQNRGNNGAQHLLELLAWQIGSFDPIPVRHGDKNEPIFIGDKGAMTLVTNYSLKALSRGAPVIARYVYSPKERLVYYGEMPLNTDKDYIAKFLEMTPPGNDPSISFFSLDVADFSIEYLERPEGLKADKKKQRAEARKRNQQAAGAGGEEPAKLKKKDNGEGWEGDLTGFDGIIVSLTPVDGSRPLSRVVIPGFLDFQTLVSSDAKK